MSERPKNIGIRAIQVHFPRNYITQDDLEERDIEILGEENRPKIKGKYTKGLGQTALAFCTDREDTVSIAMNAVSSLFEDYNLSPEMFGRVEVGTESGIDKSKSIKSFLMQLFPNNSTLIGVDNTNACYGGTAALLNSLAWIESSQWDGRLALVVTADIAVYEEMSPRPTGGCGAVAIVLGPDAPIVIEPGLLYSHFVHGYDFYKPNPVNPHPCVDGPLSLTLYYECLDRCFIGYRKKCGNNISINDFNYVCFHTPFMNHIKKCTGRLVYLADKKDDDPEIDSTRSDNRLFSQLSQQAKPIFEEKVAPSCTLSMWCGNGYTSSLYMAISSLIDSSDLDGKRVLCFSYGSGCASTMYSLKINGDLTQMKAALNLKARLEARSRRTVIEYEEAVKRENERYLKAPYQPHDGIDELWPNSWYLEGIDDQWKRTYKRRD